MGRQIRRVATDWNHPKNKDGGYVPLSEEQCSQGECFQLYEDTSEGTPLSPVFEKEEELMNYITKEGDYSGDIWTKAAAERIIKNGWAPSFVVIDGKFIRPHEQE